MNIPANAPHRFQNKGDQPARLLCLCAPSGQEKFFKEVGTPVPSRTAPAPKLSEAELAAFLTKAGALAPTYRTELLPDA
ncbi:MAG: cupin domain-containing protein [Deinococcus sp.]